MKSNKIKCANYRGNSNTFAAIILWILALLLAPMMAKAQISAYVSNFDELRDAINGYAEATDDTVIIVTAGFSVTDGLQIPANAGGYSLTMRSADAANPVTLMREGDNCYELFYLGDIAKLILENIIIDGNKSVCPDEGSPLLYVGYDGELTINDGAVLTNNHGGGVIVGWGGTFNMTGGEISGNTAEYGGGVNVGGTFTITGGEIVDNTAESGGGVFVYYDGTFTMTGGEIADNIASGISVWGGDIDWGSGGGVHVWNGGTFTMVGGEISNNTANNGGGGVYVWNGGKFTMTGGEIVHNAAMSGGGVHVNGGRYYADYEGTFNMTGGEISGNTAMYGGGVYSIGAGADYYGEPFAVGNLNLGGTAVISGNTNSNVFLNSQYSYITLSTDTPPAPGMNIGVRDANGLGVIVQFDAREEDADYFHSEEEGTEVVYDNDQLVIVDTLSERIDFYRQIEDYASAVADVTIKVSQDFRLIAPVIVPWNENDRTLTIRSADAANPVTLTRVVCGNLITVDYDAKLVLENIIIDGNKDACPANASSPLVYVSIGEDEGGKFTMKDGAVLTNNRGSGVYVDWNGRFDMEGGHITGNTGSAETLDVGSESYGGGVYVEWFGIFNMTGGEISGNVADYGGGVYIGGEFTMTGGEINSNTAYYGGGVMGSYYGTFYMTGGEISGNAADYGGGVYGWNEMFTLGGTAVISDNANGNVYLGYDQYITLSTDIPPAPGMNIGVRSVSGLGVIVPFGAREEDADYFHSDLDDTAVAYENDQLLIIDAIPARAAFYRQIADYATSGGDVIIEISQDLKLIAALNVPGNTNDRTLTIRSANPANPVTLTRDIDANLFTVNSGAKLELENIIIDGNKDAYPYNYYSIVYVANGGEFTMKNGAVLTNNADRGVHVQNGTFKMSSGTISSNNVGVYVYGGTFTMDDGDIRDNTSYYSGGGVYVSGGTFTMNGGDIRDNAASNYGGGVYVSGGTFTMNGGDIRDNSANDGGGVYVSGGIFTMNRGDIRDNSGSRYGGGVYVVSSGRFTMTGGEISGNTADIGGGVGFSSYNTFTLGGTAVICGNTTNDVYLSSGYITISTETPPAPGMNVCVQTARADGVIVNSGANPGDEQYFFDGETIKEVVYDFGRLIWINATGVVLDITDMLMSVGDSIPISATVYPLNATNKDIIWSSSNRNVVAVNAGGVITARSAGTAIITVTTASGRHTASSVITVVTGQLNMVGIPRPSIPSGTYVPLGTGLELSSDTDGAVIYYTTDGTTPTESGSVYSSPIIIANDTTIKAIACKAGMDASNMVSYGYGVLYPVPVPVADVNPGIVPNNTRVTLSSGTANVVIRFTLDGSTPTDNSQVFTTPIVITETTTIKARAFTLRNDVIDSDTAVFTYESSRLCRRRRQIPC